MEKMQLSQNIYIETPTFLNKNIVNIILIKSSVFIRRYHTRKQLMKLSIEQLRDVGISQEQALEECQKSFWK